MGLKMLLFAKCKFFFSLTYFPLFAPKAPRLIEGAYNNTIIRLKKAKTNGTKSYNKYIYIITNVFIKHLNSGH